VGEAVGFFGKVVEGIKGGVDEMVMEKEILSQDIYFLCF